MVYPCKGIVYNGIIIRKRIDNMLHWKELITECESCSKCDLSGMRKNMVFGEGNPNARLVFIGEAPGADEDRLGRPFVGRAGQLLDKGLNALDLHRDKDYYICNVCKCRPENNRTPDDTEANNCLPYLRNQIALIKPKIIVCLGAVAMRYILGSDFKITRDRGKWIEKRGVYIIATFHPAALFRDESKKIDFWKDLKSIKEKYKEIE